MRTVDHEGEIPLYIQLADILREMIASGELPPHRPIPSIRFLVETHGVADQTVKKAVQVLRDEGLVRTVPGKGVYVIDRSARR